MYKKDEVNEQFSIMHIEEPRDLCSSPNIITVMDYRKLRRAGNMVGICCRRNALEDFCLEDSEGEYNINMDH
jgi:hypothetical protein